MKHSVKLWLAKKDSAENARELEAARQRQHFWQRRVRNLERAQAVTEVEIRKLERK